MDNVLFCHSSIERILTSLMKKFCEKILKLFFSYGEDDLLVILIFHVSI